MAESNRLLAPAKLSGMLLCLRAFLLMHCTIALAEPAVSTRLVHYPVYPQSAASLESELDRRSPLREGDEVFHGDTQWRVEWFFSWKDTGAVCAISSVSTTLTVDYIMPAVAPDCQPTAEAGLAFGRLYQALFSHERNHMMSGLLAARDIERELGGMTDSASCDRMESRANRAATDIIRKYNQRDLEYDRQTDHGRLE